MSTKLKNIIILAAVAIVLVLVYVFFIAGNEGDDANLTYSPTDTPAETTGTSGQDPMTQDFLYLLLNVKNIKLDDTIFSDPAFFALHDSSIVLVQEGNEGRPNPFAPLGFDPAPTVTPSSTLPTMTPGTGTTTGATPPPGPNPNPIVNPAPNPAQPRPN